MANTSYSKPLVVGVTEYPNPKLHPDVDVLLRDLGSNSGNMMFSTSLQRRLRGARSIQYDDVYNYRINDGVNGGDCLVFAAANWMNEHEDFDWAYKVLVKSDLPLVVVGLGAQASTDFAIPKLKDGTIRFLKLVSERSALISTRGAFSSEVLEHYGIKNSEPTGCPSLLLRDSIKMTNRSQRSGVVLHGTRHLRRASDSPLQAYFYAQARKYSYDILLQSELADVRISLLGEKHGLNEEIMSILKNEYGLPTDEEVVNFIGSYGKFFTTFEDWMQYSAGKSLFVGTRIHGTIASILAGTPGVLVTHDARTLELARTMSIPFVEGKDVDLSKDIDIKSYMKVATDPGLKEAYESYQSSFADFFRKNGLELL